MLMAFDLDEIPETGGSLPTRKITSFVVIAFIISHEVLIFQ